MKAMIESNNQIISSHVMQASSFLKRLKGLMFSASLSKEHSLWIKPCNSIHTFFMRYPIDVLFLSSDQLIVDMRKNIKPYRVTSMIKYAHSVLELHTGTIDHYNIQVGDKVRFTT